MKGNNSRDKAGNRRPEIGRGKPSKKRPWCWQEKKILRAIGEIFDATNDVTSARSVYLALSELASDEQSDIFKKPVSEIARRAGISYRTASTILRRFEELSLVVVMRNTIVGTSLQAPNTYTLCNDCRPLGNTRPRSPLPRFKKESEKNQEKVEKTYSNGSTPSSKNAGWDEEEAIYAAYPRKVGRPTAMRAIRKALKQVPADKLLKWTKLFAQRKEGSDMQFCPYPATWFNEERYNDDPSTWGKGRPRPITEEEYRNER